jgi:hypothetical protein
MRRRFYASLLLLSLFAAPARAASGYTLELLTMAPGNFLFARFGHNALLVRDHATGKDEVYNYGTLRGDDPDLLSKYLARKLKYWLSMTDLASTLKLYAGRTVTAQTLDLSPPVAARVVERLRIQARPENREYLYDHFLDNCSTRLRDLIDDAAGGAVRTAFLSTPTGTTIRQELESILGPVPFERFGVSYILSGAVDHPATRWELMFLPRYLRDGLREIRVSEPGRPERPLVSAERRLVEGSVEPTEIVEWPLQAIAAAFLFPMFLGAVTGQRRRATRIAAGIVLLLWGLAAAAGSGVMIYLWSTELPATQANGTLYLNTPLHALLAPFAVLLALGRLGPRGARWLRRLLGAFFFLAAGSLLAYFLGMAEKAQVGMTLFSMGMSALGIAATRGAPAKVAQRLPVPAPAAEPEA